MVNVIEGRPVYFDVTDASREIFESIIISRFSVTDADDEVLVTDAGLAFVEKGDSTWRLELQQTEVLAPSTETASVQSDGSVEPDRAEVEATWYSPIAARATGLSVLAGGNANVFHGIGAVLIADDLRIPVVTATRSNVGYYGLTLVENQEVFELRSEEFELVMARYCYKSNYRRDFLTEVPGGGGYFVETHNFPHIHAPLSPDCGGYITIGKQIAEHRFSFTAFRIPYGYALLTPANTIHGDGTIVGDYAITVAITSAPADTVLFYDEHTKSMAAEIFADNTD